jgi:hypothetical protein
LKNAGAQAASDRTRLLFLLIPLLLINLGCGLQILTIVNAASVMKEDYAEANSIRNGLLSVDVWKSHLEKIAAARLAQFKLTGEQEEAVREAVEKALNALIDETGKMMQKPQKTLRGKVRKLAFKVLVDTASLTEAAPEYAQAVIDEVKKPENMTKMKEAALKQIEAAKTSQEEGAPLQELLHKYQASTVEEFNDRVGTLIQSSQKKVRRYSTVMIASVFLFLFAWWQVREKPDLHKTLYALSVALAFILLLSALALPMIDIDARIKNIDFLLLGEHLQFNNQLLFYRSKSVMQMVNVLMFAGHADTLFVGFLIFLFSIVFPITKLVAALCSLYGGEKLRHNKVVHFFAFDSGKWSMADVMVVAIFMAYIGFNGVLNGQLKGLNFQSQAVGAIATNQTALQTGFTLFLAYVLYSLALSFILKRMSR